MEDSRQSGLTTEITQETVEKKPLVLTTQSTDLCNDLEQPMDDDVIIDIEAMLPDSEDGLLLPMHGIYRMPSIYRVPPRIRNAKEAAYTPRVISIGPLHYGNERLQDMERHKQILFKRFTRKAMTSLDNLVNFVKQSKSMVRASYLENIKHSEKEFVKMIFVDAGFIIEFFMSCHNNERKKDAKLSRAWLSSTVVIDLLLIENQLPFFFLEGLFNEAFPLGHRGDLPSFLDLTYWFFQEFNQQKLNPNANIHHFTDLLRFLYLREAEPERSSLEEVRDHVLPYTASELREAGVKFKVSASKCLLDLKFSGHVLEIPHILLDEDTEVLFRNIIAFEQCHYPSEGYITDYAILLDCLINTDKDVDLLIHRKIIHNYLSDSNHAAMVFNSLRSNCVLTNFNSDYLDMCKRLDAFYQNPWHKLKATLKHDYFKTPWQAVASIGGIILLILTLVQAIFSILQVVLKK